MWRVCFVLLAMGGLAVSPALADPPGLAFRATGDGEYEFDTGIVRGRLRKEGIGPLVHVASGTDLAGRAMSYYRVFSSGVRYGDRACGWPAESRLLPDGSVTIAWPPADVNPLVDGSYLMFPRDRQAVQMIFDGRWDRPPSPVRWSVTRWLAAPMVVRRHEPTGATIVMMAPPEDCFAVAMPYNKTPPDGVAGHFSIYLSLFGRDLAAGQPAQVRARLVIGANLTDQQATDSYARFIKER